MSPAFRQGKASSRRQFALRATNSIRYCPAFTTLSSRGPGHRPFTAVTRVRIPLGSLPSVNCPKLALSVNHTFGSVRHRLVSFRQKFGQNRKVPHWILRGFRVGLNIDNVSGRQASRLARPVQDRTASEYASAEIMDRATLVRLGTLGISIQPASSKNHGRRSTLINKSWIGENRCNGSVNSPANGWPR